MKTLTFRTLLYFFILGFYLLLCFPLALTAQEADPLMDEDPLAAEDPLSMDADPLGSGDPLGAEDDPFAADDAPEIASEEMASIPEFKPILNFKQKIWLQAGIVEQENGGLVNSNTEGKETKQKVFLVYDYKIKIQTSPYDFFYTRVEAFGKSEYIVNTDRYTDDYDAVLHEAFRQSQSGRNRIRTGLIKPHLGRVDLESPINILSKSNSFGKESLNEESMTFPVMGGIYDWLGDSMVFSLYTAPFRIKTPGTEYTYSSEDEERQARGDDAEDRTVTRPYYGATAQLTLGSFTFRLGAFQWFDPDNEIAWSQQSDDSQALVTSVEVDDTYSEKETTIQFASFDWEWNMDNWLLKGDHGWFDKKNVYHFFKDASGDRHFETRKIKHSSYAITLERKWDKLFLMPGYAFKKLYDVPANSHILFYENEDTIPVETRDLEKETYSLAILYQFTDTFKVNLLGQHTQPFQENRISSTIDWNPGSGKHTFQLKLAHSKTEVIKSTNLPAGAKAAYLNYTYQF